MRRITLPPIDWPSVKGAVAIVPVLLDWPELRLTDDQVVQNAVAWSRGDPTPHPNLNLVEVVVPRPVGA